MDLFGIKFNIPQLNFLTRQKARLPYGRMYGNSAVMMAANGQAYIKQYGNNLAVYSIINKILRAASKTTWTLEERTGEGWETVEHHAILDLLSRPNPTQGGSEFIEAVLGYKFITGESMIFHNNSEQSNQLGLPLELWPLAPTIVNVKFDEWGVPLSYEIKLGASNTRTIEAQDITWLKSFNPDPSNPRGCSPLGAARYALTTNNSAYEAQARLLQNGGPKGIFTSDEYLPPTQVANQKEWYEENYGGSDKYGEIAFFGNKWNWQNLGMSAVDLALLETQQYTLRDLCNIYGISSQLLNDPENSTYNNVSEARKDMISNVVISEIDSMKGELQRSIVKKFEDSESKEYRLGFDKMVWEELREDMNAKVDMLTKAYWLSPNEKRESMNKESLDNPMMDEVFIPSNLLPLGFGSDDEAKRLLEEYNRKE